jgi:hypothetical protein
MNDNSGSKQLLMGSGGADGTFVSVPTGLHAPVEIGLIPILPTNRKVAKRFKALRWKRSVG